MFTCFLRCVVQYYACSNVFTISWRDDTPMSIASWMALLSVAPQFKFTEVEVPARREVFEVSALAVLFSSP